MDATRMIETFRSYIDAQVANDLEAASSAIADDVVYCESYGPEYRGIGQFRAWFAQGREMGLDDRYMGYQEHRRSRGQTVRGMAFRMHDVRGEDVHRRHERRRVRRGREDPCVARVPGGAGAHASVRKRRARVIACASTLPVMGRCWHGNYLAAILRMPRRLDASSSISTSSPAW